MALTLKKKKKIVYEIHQIANKAKSAIIANSSKIPVNAFNKLRKEARKENVFICMVKNTLLSISLKNTDLECLNTKLVGPILIGFALQHPGRAAKIFTKFEKKFKNFRITTASYNKKILSTSEIISLANLPSFKEAIIRFMITLKHKIIGKIIFILLAIKNKKTIIVN